MTASFNDSVSGWGQFLHASTIPVFGTLVILLVGMAVSRIGDSTISKRKVIVS